MKDSATGEMDSFHVDNYYVNNSDDIERIAIYIRAKNPTPEMALNVKYTGASLSFFKLGTPSDEVAYDITTNYPFWLGNHDPYNAQYEMHLYTKLPINGILEDSVYQACCNSSVPYNKYNDTIYFNRSKGLLQLKLNNTIEVHNWILQSQDIIR